MVRVRYNSTAPPATQPRSQSRTPATISGVWLCSSLPQVVRPGNHSTYWFFALMADEESMKQHGQSEAMQAAMSAFGPLVAARPEMTVTHPVAAIGLDV